MNPWKILILSLASLAAAAWSADAARYPLRQIDRPLILPRRMWQELLVQSSVFHIEAESTYLNEDVPAGFLPLLPSVSLTDNLQWSNVPAPLFRYLLTRNNINAENGPAVKDFSLTLDGGLSGLVYAREEFDVFYNLGLSAKKPVLDWLWLEGSLQSYFQDRSPLSLSSSAGLGFQFTDRFYGTGTYSLVHMLDDGYRIYQGASLGLGMNFTANLSLGLQASLLVGNRTTIFNPGAVLSFQW